MPKRGVLIFNSACNFPQTLEDTETIGKVYKKGSLC